MVVILLCVLQQLTVMSTYSQHLLLLNTNEEAIMRPLTAVGTKIRMPPPPPPPTQRHIDTTLETTEHKTDRDETERTTQKDMERIQSIDDSNNNNNVVENVISFTSTQEIINSEDEGNDLENDNIERALVVICMGVSSCKHQTQKTQLILRLYVKLHAKLFVVCGA